MLGHRKRILAIIQKIRVSKAYDPFVACSGVHILVLIYHLSLLLSTHEVLRSCYIVNNRRDLGVDISPFSQVKNLCVICSVAPGFRRESFQQQVYGGPVNEDV